MRCQKCGATEGPFYEGFTAVECRDGCPRAGWLYYCGRCGIDSTLPVLTGAYECPGGCGARACVAVNGNVITVWEDYL